MPNANIEMLQTVVGGLEELISDLVFVGGAVAELYANEPSASDIRPTVDVDCVIRITSRLEYTKLEEKLRAKGFSHDISEGAPICRWVYKGVKADVMPTDERILGFSNKWYDEGIENRIKKELPDGNKIFIFQSEYYLSSKFDAHKNRGGNDLRQSHDFEDIIYVLDNSSGIIANVRKANDKVKEYLKIECGNLLENDSLNEGIEGALPYGAGIERIDLVRTKIEEISNIEL